MLAPASKASREVANLTEKKTLSKNLSVCLSVCLSVRYFHLYYLRTGEIRLKHSHFWNFCQEIITLTCTIRGGRKFATQIVPLLNLFIPSSGFLLFGHLDSVSGPAHFLRFTSKINWLILISRSFGWAWFWIFQVHELTTLESNPGFWPEVGWQILLEVWWDLQVSSL